MYRCQRIVNKAGEERARGECVGVRACVCVFKFSTPRVRCEGFVGCFFLLRVVFACVVVRSSVPAPFGLYPKAVLQAGETSEGRSLGRLRDVSRDHLSPATNPPTKLKGSPYEAFMRALAGPGLPPNRRFD